jgi:hypothetical protein
MTVEHEAYLGEHIRDALAHDDTVAELDIHVTVTGPRIVVTGNVADRQRLAAVDAVLAGLDLGDHQVSNCVAVMRFVESTDREELS